MQIITKVNCVISRVLTVWRCFLFIFFKSAVKSVIEKTELCNCVSQRPSNIHIHNENIAYSYDDAKALMLEGFVYVQMICFFFFIIVVILCDAIEKAISFHELWTTFWHSSKAIKLNIVENQLSDKIYETSCWSMNNENIFKRKTKILRNWFFTFHGCRWEF